MTHKDAIKLAEDAMLSSKIPEPGCNKNNYRKCPGCSATVDRCAYAILAAWNQGWADYRDKDDNEEA